MGKKKKKGETPRVRSTKGKSTVRITYNCLYTRDRTCGSQPGSQPKQRSSILNLMLMTHNTNVLFKAYYETTAGLLPSAT
jgi:hypothetical protein